MLMDSQRGKTWCQVYLKIFILGRTVEGLWPPCSVGLIIVYSLISYHLCLLSSPLQHSLFNLPSGISPPRRPEFRRHAALNFLATLLWILSPRRSEFRRHAAKLFTAAWHLATDSHDGWRLGRQRCESIHHWNNLGCKLFYIGQTLRLTRSNPPLGEL